MPTFGTNPTNPIIFGVVDLFILGSDKGVWGTKKVIWGQKGVIKVQTR